MQFYTEPTFEHFWRKFQDFSGQLFSKFKKFQTWVSHFIFYLAKHVHAKFQFSSFNPDRLRQILKKILGFFRKTLKRIPKNSKSEYAV
jgi:hypothetical protein